MDEKKNDYTSILIKKEMKKRLKEKMRKEGLLTYSELIEWFLVKTE